MYRIYYENKEPLDSEDGPPVGENARGVQIIIQSDDNVGWYSQSGEDYFIFRDGKWIGVDINGLFDFLMDTGLVVFGRMIDSEKYNNILKEAMNDQSLGEKTGFMPRRFKETTP